MIDDECSDCYLEMTQRQWTQLLLNWLSECVVHKTVKQFSVKNLLEVINKYKEDFHFDEFDKLLICSDDYDAFFEYKFPILRLKNLDEDIAKRLYIMTSVILYYCCTKSITGQADADICQYLETDEQMIILKFCEALADMEVTINNVDRAVKVAFETVEKENLIIYSETQIAKQIDSELSENSTFVSSEDPPKRTTLKFKSSITVLPSVVTDISLSRSSLIQTDDESDVKISYLETKYDREIIVSSDIKNTVERLDHDIHDNIYKEHSAEDSSIAQCQPDCSCTKCNSSGPCCGDIGRNKDLCGDNEKVIRRKGFNGLCVNWRWYITIGSLVILLLIVFLSTLPLWWKINKHLQQPKRFIEEESNHEISSWAWICIDNFCQKVFQLNSNKSTYSSLSRCTLLCTGLQLWPYPIGYVHHSKMLVEVSTNKLEYKINSVPSVAVQKYLSEAFKLFLQDLVRLETSGNTKKSNDRSVKKINIQIDVESDSDPRIRLNTDESYTLKLEMVKDVIFIIINSLSFCGVRHGLETLSQVFLLDRSTGSLITFSNIIIKDAPTYKYRGLMIDTARNFIQVKDILRTIDAMATCKLNTFHWRISDATSFPLYLDKIPELYEYGAYDRSMTYTKEDVKFIVKRAGVRGIRILIEIAAPGPVGRPWSWLPEANCPRRGNFTCNNVYCLRLSMNEPAFNVLQTLYSEILDITNVDDIFHLSDSVFSLYNCYSLLDDRHGYLDKALERLKMANKGFLPRLPIIWYSAHLRRAFESNAWERLGVQLNNWEPNSFSQDLSKFRVIHSSKWDLSCEMKKQRCIKYKTWQQMYAWKSWRNVDAFTIEGGESVLWTDLVDSSNLDYHLWPRAAAVAECLWSDMVTNSSANKNVYLRLDSHRKAMFCIVKINKYWRQEKKSRMVLLHDFKVQPLWPAKCTFNPSACLDKVQ